MISNNSLNNNNINKTNKKIPKYCPDISLINSQLDSDTGNTPLILSILSQDIKSFLELLSLGVNPNITNYSGETPLHISILKGFNDYIILLLKYDVNPNIKNNLGQTAMHLAIINKLEENILQRLKEKNGDIYNIKDNFNKTAFDYAKEKEREDKNYINILEKIFGKKEKNKFGLTWNEKKLSDIINEIKNNNKSQSYICSNNFKKINDKYYLDTLLNNHSERNKTKYEQNDIYESSKLNRLNSEMNNKEIKLDDFTESIKEKENKDEEKKKSINKKYTHGRAMLCGDLNSNNIQIKELNNSSDVESEKSKKTLSDFLAEEINNLDVNNFKGNFDIVDINNNTDNYNKNINVSRIYSQKSESSALSKITEDKENSNLNSNMISNIPFSHSSSKVNTYKSDKSNLSNKQSLYQSNSLNNKSIIKNIINDTVKKIEVKSIASSEGGNLSNLNILSKESEKSISKKNNEFNIKSNTNNDNFNLYENGTTSIVMYKNKNPNEINNKDNKNINISNINEDINIITYTNKTDKSKKTNITNKTNEFNQDNNINRNKTIILSNLNNLNSSKNIQESSLNTKNKEIKDNIFLNPENSHIFSDLNTYTNNYNNVSLSYSKNIQSDELNKTNTKNKSNNKKDELNIKSINNSNNSLHGSNYSNNTKKKRISNGNPNNSTGIKKSKSFVDSTSMKKSNFNKSIYNKLELENLNLKNNENIESNDKGNKIGNHLNNFLNDKIYKKHHRQPSYHINYKSGLNNNKEKEIKRNNTKEIISNFNILRTSNKKDKIYQNKNNIVYYSNTKSNNSESKIKNDNINSNKNNKNINTNKDSLIGINKSIKSLTSTNNPNITVTHNVFANSITNTNNNNNNNDSNLNNDNIKNKTKKISTNKILSRNYSNYNTAFSTLNKQNRLSKFSTNNNLNNIRKKNQKINFNDDIIYNDDDYEDENDFNCDIRNINTDVLLRLREFLLSCDLLCYFNLMIEKKVYKIDSYINNIQEGITPLTYEKLENIGIKKPGHIFRILIKLDIDAGIIDNNLFNFIIEKINYRAYTTTTLAMSSSIIDVNCCGINICSNSTNFGNRKSGRNTTFNFSDLSSFLRLYNLKKFKGNFIFNGFDKIEFILIQMFSRYIFDQKILNNYLHIYINKDRIKLLNKLYTIKSSIAKEFGIEVDYNEYNKIMGIKTKTKLINISNISNEKKSIRRNMSYIQNINNTYFNETNSIKNSLINDENTDISNPQNENNCNIF